MTGKERVWKSFRIPRRLYEMLVFFSTLYEGDLTATLIRILRDWELSEDHNRAMQELTKLGERNWEMFYRQALLNKKLGIPGPEILQPKTKDKD